MANSICFISRHAHYVLLGNTKENIGGAEFQQVIIAKALRDQGWRVSFITERVANGTPRMIGGIELISVIDYVKGSPLMRRLFTIPIQLWKFMKLVDAQIYYQRNPGAFSSLIGIFCRLKGRRFVLAGANDANFDRGNELNVNSKLDLFDIKCGVKLADIIVLQSERQRYLLKKYYGRDGPIFYNLYEAPPSYNMVQLPCKSDTKPKLLWVGRLARQKRPEQCCHLAQLLPDFEIILVGANTHQRELTEKIRRDVQSIPNISYVGHLPLPNVEDLFNSTQALINTSYVEGFPNTFLQAWSRGMPVFSFIDPDNLIAKHDLGCKVSSVEDMANAIRKKLCDEVSFQQNAEKIRSFFNDNFLVSLRIQDLEKLLCSPYRCKSRRSSEPRRQG